MKTKVYSLFDTKAAYYGVPFFMHNSGMALRAFSDLVCDKMSLVSKHPEDFNLYEIGEFDDSTAVLVSYAPVALGNAAQFVKYVGSEETGFLGPLFDSNGKETKVIERAS